MYFKNGSGVGLPSSSLDTTLVITVPTTLMRFTDLTVHKNFIICEGTVILQTRKSKDDSHINRHPRLKLTEQKVPGAPGVP